MNSKTRRNWYKNTVKIRREKTRLYYIRTKDVRRKYQTDYAAIRRRLVYSLKNKPCADCFGWFEPCQMEFDHLPGYHKKFTMGNTLSRAIKTILIEAKKCEVICSNCHRLRTYRRAYDNQNRVIGGFTSYILPADPGSDTARVP